MSKTLTHGSMVSAAISAAVPVDGVGLEELQKQYDVSMQAVTHGIEQNTYRNGSEDMRKDFVAHAFAAAVYGKQIAAATHAGVAVPDFYEDANGKIAIAVIEYHAPVTQRANRMEQAEALIPDGVSGTDTGLEF